MIDIENQVYTTVITALEEQYPGVMCSSEYVQQPPELPHVSLWESNNTEYQQTFDGKERHSRIVYEVNVYSNKEYGRKTECRNILKIVDAEMSKLGFSRINMQSIPNVLDVTVYRMWALYEALVDENNVIYRR